MEIVTVKNIFIRHSQAPNAQADIWFIHGFADSGLGYQEAFTSSLAQNYNLYVVDMPGYGASPLNPACSTMTDQANLLAAIIAEKSGDQVVLVAHSIGGLLGTHICEVLQDSIAYYFSVEGNLTEADSYFSSKPLQYDTAEAFFTDFEQEIFTKGQTEPRFRRYYSSVRFAQPEAMRNWATSSQALVKDNRCGFAFKDLTCPKVYIWGDVDTPTDTQQFIQEHQLPNQLFAGVGHWHMHENVAGFYAFIEQSLDTK